MISVKCPNCGLVDWNVGNCKRCETPLVGLDADGNGGGYFSAASDDAAQTGSVRTARRVMTVCLVAVLGLAAVGALYLARKPSKKQWFWSFYRGEPTVAEIFQHNVEASGGAERFAKLRSFRGEGRLAFTGGEAARVAAAAGGQVTFVMHAKAPDRVQTEIQIGTASKETSRVQEQMRAYMSNPIFGASAQPQVGVTVRRGFDGEKGWEYVERTILTPGSTVPIKQYASRELDGDELAKMRRSAQTTNLVQLAGGYASLRLKGREAVAWGAGGGTTYAGQAIVDGALRGHEAYVVSGVSREGRDETLYFDTLTGLLLRLDFEAEDEEGEAVKVECYFGDYREVDGLKLPHRLHFRRGEESMTMTFGQYVPNDPIPDSTFQPPVPTE